MPADNELTDEGVRKLYEFFKTVHHALWEIRGKLGYMQTFLDTQRLTVETVGIFAIVLKQVKEVCGPAAHYHHRNNLAKRSRVLCVTRTLGNYMDATFPAHKHSPGLFAGFLLRHPL